MDNKKILIVGKTNLAASIIRNLYSFGVKNAVIVDMQNVNNDIQNYDIVVDSLKNFKDKIKLNEICVKNRKPLVYSNISGSFSQITTIVPEDTPCLECLFPNIDTDDIVYQKPSDKVLYKTASIEAKEVINLLLNKKETGLQNYLLTYSEFNNKTRTIKIKNNVQCELCSRL